MKKLVGYLLIISLFESCSKNRDAVPPVNNPIVIENSFNNNNESWIVDFADYPVGSEIFYELQSSHKKLPAPLDQNDGAVFVSGNNHSDDLFMFLKREITGLKKNTSYTAKFTIDFASNAPSNWAGVGGPPGEGVALGIGITLTEPIKVVNGLYYRMNIDKGNQGNSGKDRKVIGNVANGTNALQYVLLQKTGEFTFTTDNTEKFGQQYQQILVLKQQQLYTIVRSKLSLSRIDIRLHRKQGIQECKPSAALSTGCHA